MNSWFSCKVKYEKVDETGVQKFVSEAYLVDAMTYTEAEARIYKNLEEMIRGEFQITNISKAKYADVFDFDDGEIWYKCKVTYVDMDEKSGKEKKSTVEMLVMAKDLRDALDKLDQSLSTMIIPWEVKAVQDSNLMDIFPYSPAEAVDNLVTDNLRPMSEIDEEGIEH